VNQNAVSSVPMPAGLVYEVSRCRVFPYDWRAEAINFTGDGEGYGAFFCGCPATSAIASRMLPSPSCLRSRFRI
jgi:hypothetical protein